MCIYKIFTINREIVGNERILVKDDEFSKIESEAYLRVLAGEIPVSKSYYYKILSKLREFGLIRGTAINFKLVLPYSIRGDRLKIEKKALFITGRKLVYVNLSSPNCDQCPLLMDCQKAILELTGMTLKYPCMGWNKIITSLTVNLLFKTRSFITHLYK